MWISPILKGEGTWAKNELSFLDYHAFQQLVLEEELHKRSREPASITEPLWCTRVLRILMWKLPSAASRKEQKAGHAMLRNTFQVTLLDWRLLRIRGATLQLNAVDWKTHENWHAPRPFTEINIARSRCRPPPLLSLSLSPRHGPWRCMISTRSRGIFTQSCRATIR